MSSCTYNLRTADPFYQALVDRITKKLNMDHIQVYAADVPNACATLYKRNINDYNRPVITYDPAFMLKVYKHNPWAMYFVFAHEVAHHYNLDLHGNFINQQLGWAINQRSHRKELNADYVAGWILYCEGASLQDAMALCTALELNESETHPGETKRRNAMRSGWSDADCRLTPPRRVERFTQQQHSAWFW